MKRLICEKHFLGIRLFWTMTIFSLCAENKIEVEKRKVFFEPPQFPVDIDAYLTRKYFVREIQVITNQMCQD